MTSPLIAPFLLTAPGRERILAGTLASWEAARCAGAADENGGRSLLAPLVIHHDPGGDDPRATRPASPMNRILAAHRSLLARAVAESAAPFVLLLEDDVAFAPRFTERLANWSPLRNAIAAHGEGAAERPEVAATHPSDTATDGKSGAATSSAVAAGSSAVAAGETGSLPALASFFRPGVVRILAQPAPDCLIADPASFIGSQALLLSRDFAQRALAEWPRLHGFLSQRLAALAAELSHPILCHAPSLVEHTGTVSAWGGHIHRAVDFAG